MNGDTTLPLYTDSQRIIIDLLEQLNRFIANHDTPHSESSIDGEPRCIHCGQIEPDHFENCEWLNLNQAFDKYANSVAADKTPELAIMPPGEPGGPCLDRRCGHLGCYVTRQVAAINCHACNHTLDYGNLCLKNGIIFVHAPCCPDDFEREMSRLKGLREQPETANE